MGAAHCECSAKGTGRKLVYNEWDDRVRGSADVKLVSIGQAWSEMITLVRSDKYNWVSNIVVPFYCYLLPKKAGEIT